MLFPEYRPRRARKSGPMRRMVRETRLSPNDFILPLFAVSGKGVREPIASLPGHFHLSADNAVKLAVEAKNAGIPAVLLFGVPDKKDPLGTSAYDKNGVVQKAAAAIKEKLGEDLLVITDVCLCQYTDHGHCGILDKGQVDNDSTLDLLGRTAVSHAGAGADIVAPSDMMDGRVAEIREALDEEGHQDVAIMAYSAKYCSAFYGPFRAAAHSAPRFGDRRTYQMDPANAREAVREMSMDAEEGADILMVKPALSYLDVISRARDEFDLPIAAYSVSGEYAMVKAAEQMGWMDGERAMLEILLSIKRAGADMIITYAALELANKLE
jgi:porphobilinogen synthase